jgi:hypothetical protein
MSEITLAQFQRTARGLHGSVLPTLHRAERFAIRVHSDGSGVEYTPQSTGKTRTQSWEYVERVIGQYNRTHSLHPGEYKGITNHASYTLTIIERIRRTESSQDPARRAFDT